MNSNKLKAAMLNKGLSQQEIATKLGIGYQTFNNKLHGRKAEFSLKEVNILKDILGLTDKQIIEIFFKE